MYVKALLNFERLMVDVAVVVLRSRALAPLERIDAFLSSPIVAVRDNNDRRGCFLCNAAADRASLDEETGTLVRPGYDKMRAAIAHSLGDSFPNQPPQTISTRAEVVLTIYSGMRVISRTGIGTEMLLATKDDVMRTLSFPQK